MSIASQVDCWLSFNSSEQKGTWQVVIGVFNVSLESEASVGIVQLRLCLVRARALAIFSPVEDRADPRAIESLRGLAGTCPTA